MLRPLPLSWDTKPSFPLMIGMVWLAIAAVLTSHFRFYFGVNWHDAVKWGLGDALVWCLLLVGLGLAHRRYFERLAWRWRIGLFVGVAIFCGLILHPTAVVLLYWAIDGSISRPFPEDVAHLAIKRLPQGILAGLVMSVAGMAFARSREVNFQAVGKSGEAAAEQAAGSCLWLRLEGGVRRVDLLEIRYAEAAGNYVTLHTRDGTHLERTTMKTMAERLKPYGFRRISRKHLVNLDHVRSVRSRKPKGGLVTLDGAISLPISRNYKSDFRRAAEDHARKKAL